ncbi:MAG: FAD-dependent oxidoreductase [Clostridia bacterium]|nr:FAD-dependent oxidoreductase [Clostridia bacterium]
MKRKAERYAEAHFDVIVVGGGMAGICAAMEAARDGAQVALVHARPVLGGNASSEIRVHISGADSSLEKPDYAESGLLYELMLENKARNEQFSYSVWDMILFEAVKKQKGLTTYLNTVMYDCETNEAGDCVTAILCVQETTEMRLRLTAPLFVDATGHGTLGYYAGAEYRQGSESRAETGEEDAPEQANNERMGNTIMFRARNMGHPVKYTPPAFAKKYTEHDLRYRMHSKTHKVDYSSCVDPARNERTGGVSARGVDYGYFWIELMGEADDIITDYENIRDDLVAAIYGVWDHIKNGGDHGAENYALDWVGMLPGTRESRRLMGDYILTATDILENRVFPDAVAYGGWCIDLHAAHGLLDTDIMPSGDCRFFDGVYTVPYRCYYSKNIRNLFLAGRDISATKLAFCSTRIIGCCAVGGQAVGAAAALCTKYGCMPRELMPHIGELQTVLLRHDGYLPGFVNTDVADLARNATFTASSHQAGGEPQKVIDGLSRRMGEESHAWISDGIAEGGETLCMVLDGAKTLSQLRLTFESDFSYPIRVTMAPNRQAQQREGIPAELVKDYDVVLSRGGSVARRIEVRDNHQRHNVLNFDPTVCDKVELVAYSTHGAPNVTVFEVRAYELAD